MGLAATACSPGREHLPPPIFPSESPRCPCTNIEPRSELVTLHQSAPPVCGFFSEGTSFLSYVLNRIMDYPGSRTAVLRRSLRRRILRWTSATSSSLAPLGFSDSRPQSLFGSQYMLHRFYVSRARYSMAWETPRRPIRTVLLPRTLTDTCCLPSFAARHSENMTLLFCFAVLRRAAQQLVLMRQRSFDAVYGTAFVVTPECMDGCPSSWKDPGAPICYHPADVWRCARQIGSPPR